MHRSPRVTRWSLLTVVAALLVVGCGVDAKDDSAPPPSVTVPADAPKIPTTTDSGSGSGSSDGPSTGPKVTTPTTRPDAPTTTANRTSPPTDPGSFDPDEFIITMMVDMGMTRSEAECVKKKMDESGTEFSPGQATSYFTECGVDPTTLGN